MSLMQIKFWGALAVFGILLAAFTFGVVVGSMQVVCHV